VKIGFYSCMSGVPWGGSEELWWRAARLLQSQGHEVTVNYKWWPEAAKQLRELESDGGEIWFREEPKSFWQNKADGLKQMFSSNNNDSVGAWLESTKPDAVLVSLGYHPDRIKVADPCTKLGIPYAINVQSASSFFFLHSDCLPRYRRWYENASKVFFVSEENQLKIQNNIATQLTNVEIVANPFNVAVDSAPVWPSEKPCYKIACVGRIHFQSKGQDLIVDVMKQQKWKDRPIEITFYGHDQGQGEQLKALIEMHGLQDRLKIGGFVERVEQIWEENHALLLPSRYEGAPLVVIESMLCNRIGIVTDIGRNRELIDDGQSGFIADGAVAKLIDDALERAWEKREQWQAMGVLAGQQIRARYPLDPIGEFADRLLQLGKASTGKSTATQA